MAHKRIAPNFHFHTEIGFKDAHILEIREAQIEHRAAMHETRVTMETSVRSAALCAAPRAATSERRLRISSKRFPICQTGKSTGAVERE